jgi:hypothetical protein
MNKRKNEAIGASMEGLLKRMEIDVAPTFNSPGWGKPAPNDYYDE